MADEKPVEISFSSVRNGDRLGHDHLDSAEISVGGYSITINKDVIAIRLPIIVDRYPSSMGRHRDMVIKEHTVIDSMGYMTKLFYVKNNELH